MKIAGWRRVLCRSVGWTARVVVFASCSNSVSNCPGNVPPARQSLAWWSGQFFTIFFVTSPISDSTPAEVA